METPISILTLLAIRRPWALGSETVFARIVRMNTVEGIGIRSTKLCALDQSLISVLNAQFADMQIINFAHRDQFMIDENIGIRYETEADQMRYLLVQLRELLIAHPMIDTESVRVRLSAFGSSALDINIRVYVKTADLEEFAAIKQDVLLRILDIVKKTGTEIAFPSQTLYVSQDGLRSMGGEGRTQPVFLLLRERGLQDARPEFFGLGDHLVGRCLGDKQKQRRSSRFDRFAQFLDEVVIDPEIRQPSAERAHRRTGKTPQRKACQRVQQQQTRQSADQRARA
jgi:hypothetical protein